MAFISRFDNRKPKQPDDLVNERVRFKEVLVIDQNGDQLGVKSSREALDIAYDANLDLVCVAPNAKPPVCRIMDFGKYRFEQQKKAREMKKNSKVVTLKETQLSVTIDTHDKNVKLKRTLKWLEEGNKVKVAIRFRGRQLAHVDLGKKVIDDFVEECAEVGQIEKIISKKAKKILESIKLFDIYRDEKIGIGKKSVAYSLIFRDKKKTLSDSESTSVMDGIVAEVEKTLGATLRK